jgi:hypothetical protein
MRRLLLLSQFVFAAPQLADAFPAVGDKATYYQTAEDSLGSARYTVTSEIIGVDEHNWFVVRRITRDAAGTQIEVNDRAHHPRRLPSITSTALNLKNCVSRGGVLEDVTVRAGLFKTCRMRSGNLSQWLGAVPFGVIKSQLDLGWRRSEEQLVSYEPASN